MPVETRSRSASENTTPTSSEESTAASNTTGTTTESGATGTTETSTTSRGTNVTNETTVTGAVQASNNAAASALPRNDTNSRPPNMPRSTGSRSRRKELALARVELLTKQAELAAAKVALLEEESDEEEEDDVANITVREELTSHWIQSTKLALTQEPHNREESERAEDVAPAQRERETHVPLSVRASEARTQPQRTEEMPPAPLYTSQHGAAAPSPIVESYMADAHPSRAPARYHQGSPANDGFNYRELADAITLAAHSMHPAPVSRCQELPQFNGTSSDWLPFKAAYEESAALLTEQENLGRLRRSLKGAAKEAAHSLFVGATTAAEVMKLLTSNFGRPNALVSAEMDKLRSLPRLTENPRDICVFASKVQNIVATVRALKQLHYLYNTEVVRGVVEKLPSALRYRYYDHAADVPEGQPDLITLAKFLERTAERCGPYTPAESTPTHDRREPPAKRAVRNYHASEQSTTPSNTITCPVCSKESHQTPQCAKFKEADTASRWELAKSHKLCFRCLRHRKFRHTCKTKKCNIEGCTYSRHPLLHSTQTSPPQQTANIVDTQTQVTIASAKETGLLKILPVQVAGPKGTYNTYALLDDGFTCTVIEAATAKKIGVTGPSEPFYIEGVAGMKIDALQARRVRFNISGRGTTSYDISARTMESLQLSPQSVSRDVISAYPHLADLTDQLLYEDATPTILLGQDNWHLLLTHDVRRGERHQPVASLTDLGWVLHGLPEVRARQQIHKINHVVITESEEQSMEEQMKQHFSLDSLGVEAKRSLNDEEKRALQILEEKTQQLPSGGYETGLLWRTDNLSPPNSYDTAMRRLELVEKKLDRNEDLKRRYKNQLQTLVENDYAELAPTSKQAQVWYLPHFAVINPQKPDKLRLVHDAAAKTKGLCLNDMLLSGPDLLQSLPGVLMRFRQRPVAVAADIKYMFLRVTIREEDRDMQRFLWRDDRRNGPPTEYRMKSVIFGATSSPCTAIFIKNKNAERFMETCPEAATAIVKNHYVDDYLASYDTEEETIRIATQVANIHGQGNFLLQRWASNSRRVLTELAPDRHENIVHLDSEKILGMVRNTKLDTLTFNINKNKIPADILEGRRNPTKREALRTIMSIYDPLGIATPVTIQAKRIMQDTWRSGIGWDTKLQPTEAVTWQKWIEEAKRLSKLAVPRCHEKLARARTTQIHTFVDASSSAYAAATYWRIFDEEGQVHVSLIAGKGRVAPLKMTSIPRLELQAAVLGCRLAQTAIEEHDWKPASRYYWSDSKTVLTWLRTGPRAYKPFVAHRVAEIAEHTKTSEWRWVPTKMNVADDATRDIPPKFNSEHRWYNGPAFLYLTTEDWPSEESTNAPEDTGEERVLKIDTPLRMSESLPDPTTARVLQFIDKLRSKQMCAIVRKRTKQRADSDLTWTKNKPHTKTTPTATSATRYNRKLVPIDARYLQRAQHVLGPLGTRVPAGTATPAGALRPRSHSAERPGIDSGWDPSEELLATRRRRSYLPRPGWRDTSSRRSNKQGSATKAYEEASHPAHYGTSISIPSRTLNCSSYKSCGGRICTRLYNKHRFKIVNR